MISRFCLIFVVLFCAGLLFFCNVNLYAECYSNTVNFDPDEGIIWNFPWTHCLPDIPEGCKVQSTEIEVRAQVWYWGWYPYVQDILASNTTVFNYSEGYVCTLTPATHPNPNNFYTIVCSLKSNQIPWLLDNNCINFIMVTFGGTYYMDYSKLEVCCSTCSGDFDRDGDVDGSDLAVFASDFGRTDCDSGPSCEGDFDKDGDVDGSDLAVFAADFGRTDCPQ
jgi:hypothetical protein